MLSGPIVAMEAFGAFRLAAVFPGYAAVVVAPFEAGLAELVAHVAAGGDARFEIFIVTASQPLARRPGTASGAPTKGKHARRISLRPKWSGGPPRWPALVTIASILARTPFAEGDG